MATVMVMPALGNSVESCLIVSWLVKEGDTIAENGILCEVETDKAATEVPSTASGTVLKLLWAEGDDVPVMQPLLVVGEPGEDPAPVLAEVGFGAAQGKALGQTAVAAVSAGTGPGAVVDDRIRTNLPNVWAIGGRQAAACWLTPPTAWAKWPPPTSSTPRSARCWTSPTCASSSSPTPQSVN